jgi:hypothetical protein
MRVVAMETMLMALRIQPSTLVLASPVGALLLDELLRSGQLGGHSSKRHHWGSQLPWFEATSTEFDKWPGRVVSFSRQVFSGNSRIPKGRTFVDVVDALR